MTYILVEGTEDKIFISYILDNLLNKKGLYEIDHNGKTDKEGSHGIIPDRVIDIKRYVEDEGYNFIIINDADNSFSKRQKELEDKIKKEQITGNIFLFPNNKDNGILEDLLLGCIPEGQEGIPNCFDCFISCLEELEKRGHKVSLPAIKSKIYTYAEVQIFDSDEYKRVKDGSYFYKKYELWNFNCEAIEPLISFLREHVK